VPYARAPLRRISANRRQPDLAMTLVNLSKTWMKLTTELERSQALLDECPPEKPA
jgi:hypothetical protein